jgi:ferredoxin-thioredoxin reductase catalytic subunit
MNHIEITENDIKKRYLSLQKDAGEGGYFLNPDTEFTKNLIKGLMKNEQRYGYPSCPCRLASGKKEQDLDIICPCDYRDPDVVEYGACYCALYVSNEAAAGTKKPAPVPERRPPRAARGADTAIKTDPASLFVSLPLPVWRCKVCGYLCAREQPPDICPICKVTKDRFERFI